MTAREEELQALAHLVQQMQKGTFPSSLKTYQLVLLVRLFQIPKAHQAPPGLDWASNQLIGMNYSIFLFTVMGC
jgi:hypothetical protein